MDQKDYRFDEVRGSLTFSETKIELELKKGDIFTGSFGVEEQEGLVMEGYVYSSNIRMLVDNPQINGNSAEITYTFDSTGMQVGDALKGNFYIVTNKGEFLLPFVAMIQRENIQSSLGVIKNLFHFTNLAKTDWDEAVEVFYHPGFEENLTGNDTKYRSLYKGLTRKGNKNYNLEEFLVGINKKQKIEYSLGEDSIKFANPIEKLSETIKITRSGWGYTMIAVKTDCEFVVLSKNRLSAMDFDGDVCEFDFSIDAQKLHPGKNSGRIIFRTLYDELEVDIEVMKNSFARKTSATAQKRSAYSLTRHYMDYTAKRISLSKWLMLSDEHLSHRGAIDEEDIATSLMTVHSLIIQEKYNEAKIILDKKVKSRIEDANNELYCYYLYMNALYSADEYYTKQVTEQIESIFNNDPKNWRIAWILIKISDEMRKFPGKRFSFALEQVRKGCISPIIYLEAIKALSENPALLIHLDEEEKRILLFGAREGILTRDIMAQVSYLVVKYKGFDKKLLRIMQLIYEKTKSDESLQGVCMLLMKGGFIGVKYLDWYKEAVDRNFPLTKLYESYMMSLDMRKDEPIPKRVLMYFSYQSTLPVTQNAYLYAYVVRTKEENMEIYLSYKESIDRFIIKQLYAGNIDRNLAYLYSKILMEEMMTEDNAKQFAKVLFKHRITVDDNRSTSVVVIDERLKDERIYKITDGFADVAILSNDYTILLEDEIGNRFYSTRDYQIEKFFMPGKMVVRMGNYSTGSPEYNLFLCEDNPDFLIVSEQNEERYRFIESSQDVSDAYKGKIRLPLVRYYLEKDDTRSIDEIIEHIDFEDVSYKDYNELIRIILIRGNTQKALEFALHYGINNVEPKTLVRLADRMIDRDGQVKNDVLTYILMGAFERGKYDDAGITYLAKFYTGPIKQLRNIWKAASNFYADTYGICEKMILQTLDTGAYIGEEAIVLKQYVEGGAKLDVEMRYLSYFAHEYFVKGRPVDDYMFSEMERIYRIEEELTEVCMLAWLQYMSTKIESDALDDRQKNTVGDLLRYLVVKKGIMFPFFKKFRDISTCAARLSNYSLVEYRGAPDTKTVINYVISRDGEDAHGYSREDMTEMYGGVYVKSFLLFFGETLQYYITEEVDGVPQFTESKTVSVNETIGDTNADRYTFVNDVAVADTLKDYDTTAKILEEYKFKEYMVDSIFSPQ